MEEFDEKKIYASAYSACLNCHLGEKKSEQIAQKALTEVKAALLKNSTQNISSSHLSILVHAALKKQNEDAAFMYSTHLDLS